MGCFQPAALKWIRLKQNDYVLRAPIYGIGRYVFKPKWGLDLHYFALFAGEDDINFLHVFVSEFLNINF